MPDNSHEPLSERFRIDAMIDGLASDLDALRAGRISVREANARAALAKQILRGVHYVVTAQRFLSDQARQIPSAEGDQQ